MRKKTLTQGTLLNESFTVKSKCIYQQHMWSSSYFGFFWVGCILH